MNYKDNGDDTKNMYSFASRCINMCIPTCAVTSMGMQIRKPGGYGPKSNSKIKLEPAETLPWTSVTIHLRLQRAPSWQQSLSGVSCLAAEDSHVEVKLKHLFVCVWRAPVFLVKQLSASVCHQSFLRLQRRKKRGYQTLFLFSFKHQVPKSIPVLILYLMDHTRSNTP